MKLYRLIVCAVFGMIALFAVAEGEYLHVKTANGVVVLDLSKVEKLSFTGGNLTATDSEAKVVARIPKSDLDKMYVSENADASSLNSVVSEDATATFVYESSSKSVRMLADGEITVYSIAGEELVSIPGLKKGEIVDLNAVRNEVVILKSGNYAVKALLK